MKSRNDCGSKREGESHNLRKIEKGEGLYRKNRPLFICTTKFTQGKSVNSFSGITLIALVVTIVVLLILASVSITAVFGDNGLFQLAKEAGEKTNEAVKNDREEIDELGDLIKDSVAGIKSPLKSKEADEKVTFSTNYGTIDVIWLDINNGVKSVPNEPILSAKNDDGQEESMTKVKWTEKQTVEADNVKWEENEESKEKPWSNSDWYNYQKAEGTDDTRNSRWANAKTANGSYFVWIPRYAYRITYYASEENIGEQEPTGYYDGWGMYDKDGNLKYKLDEGIETVAYNGNKYIVHPAFETNLDMGGWDKDLAGFWFAKFEMSGTQTDLKTVPQATSLGNINIGKMYQICRDAKYGYKGQTEKVATTGLTDADKKEHTSYMNSHLIKNSEWGAVAYLAYSSYGRNGHEIDINNSSDLINGNGGGDIGGRVEATGGTTHAYNTQIGAGASTTGNIYGIYDISGGAWEYVSSYDKNGEVTTYGFDLVKETKDIEGNYISTKYATTYEHGTDGSSVYEVSKIGDALKETRIGSESWFKDCSYVCTAGAPFFLRGGSATNKELAGEFSSVILNGIHNGMNGLRVALCP